MRNDYLEQVVQEKAQLEEDLRVKRKIAPPAPARGRRQLGKTAPRESPAPPGGVEPPAEATAAVAVRITGWWRFKNVIVPPNAYVVHTRRGRQDPVNLGLGVSFRFDPVTDAFLVVPAVMQTIIIHANCKCRERQGIVVQGYVQWIIDDFEVAYRRLDFSDAADPMRVVNVQLREQAEATIKDKVAVMGIDEVLADKQPIIEELTSRLRQVAEGEGGDTGLGLRIVTVQIKEAVVCSSKVWEMLQGPFRAERAASARLAEIENQAVVERQAQKTRAEQERLKIEAQAEVDRIQAEADAARFAREQAQAAQRSELEAASLQQTQAHERAKLELSRQLEALRREAWLDQERADLQLKRQTAEVETEIAAARRRIDNDRSDEAVRLALIEALPRIAAELPKPAELKAVSIGDTDALASLIASVRRMLAAIEPDGG